MPKLETKEQHKKALEMIIKKLKAEVEALPEPGAPILKDAMYAQVDEHVKTGAYFKSSKP